MMRKKEEQFEPKKIGRFLVSSASFPVIDRYERNQFFGREDGTLRATPLFVAPYRDRKLRHSSSADSIPVIFAITQIPHSLYLEHFRNARPADPVFRRFKVHADVALSTLGGFASIIDSW
jgi:hypothetical protein